MPSRWQTFNYLCKNFNIEGLAIAPVKAKISKGYDSSGYLSMASSRLNTKPKQVELVPLIDHEKPSRGFDRNSLCKTLRNFSPDIIWIHGEPLQQTTLDVCELYKDHSQVSIYQSAIENLPSFKTESDLHHLSRINGFLSVAEPTSQALIKVFKIDKQKIYLTYLPNVTVHCDLHSKQKKFCIGYLGRIVPEKGIDILFEAFHSLENKNIRLIIAGDGWYDYIKENELNANIDYLGIIEDSSHILSRIDVLIVPSLTTESWKEQFGRVIAEAFSIGIPVIGSDSGSIPSVIGDAGLIYPEKSPIELANRISTLANNKSLYESLSCRAKKRFENYFSVEAHAKCLAKIFDLKSLK